MKKQGESSLAWRKSSHSGSGADCIEVSANLRSFIYVRDSKNADCTELAFSLTGWAKFIGQLKGN
jgi:hypothetical protein